VLINGHDFYREYDLFRHQIGYVPQFDILHHSLTVDQALDYAARLRLPAELTRAERSGGVDLALQTVSMDAPESRGNRIANLSGGQRKRVSIAAELLADPRLIFLDEATSGLDPGLEKKMMYTLRRMADEGRTVVLITHATANIVQADHVAFLTQGRMVYFGSPEESLTFFEVDEFADIYDRIVSDGAAWETVFREEKPETYQKNVVQRQQSLHALPMEDIKRSGWSLVDFFHQLFVLTERAFKVVMSDWVTLLLLMLLFPLTAGLQLVIATPHVITGDPFFLADPVAAAKDVAEAYLPFANMNTFVFVMGLEAVLVGLFVPSTELLKERTIYLRERMINLGLLPYLSSKVIVFSCFSFIQVLLYMLVLALGVDYPVEGVFFPGIIEIFATLFLTMLAGNALGLVISALSKNNEVSIYLLTLMLFFQFFFAGTVFDLRDKPAEALSYLTTTRWSLSALGTTIDMEGIAESTVLCSTLDDPFTPETDEITRCFHYPEAVDDLLLPYGEQEMLKSWGALMITIVFGLVVTGGLIKRLDTL
jgi:ABC-type multidrug transport system ATPase subunit